MKNSKLLHSGSIDLMWYAVYYFLQRGLNSSIISRCSAWPDAAPSYHDIYVFGLKL